VHSPFLCFGGLTTSVPSPSYSFLNTQPPTPRPFTPIRSPRPLAPPHLSVLDFVVLLRSFRRQGPPTVEMSDHLPGTDYIEVCRVVSPCPSGEGCTCLLNPTMCVHSHGPGSPSNTRSVSNSRINSGNSSEDHGSEDNATSEVNRFPCSRVHRRVGFQ